MKTFHGKDGKIRLFRMDENAKRMNRSCQGVVMAELPQEIFEAAVIKAVKMNERFVPPYESGASLYIRPLMTLPSGNERTQVLHGCRQLVS